MRSLIFLTLFLVGCSSTSSNFLDFTTPKKTQSDTTVEDFKSRVGYLASDKLGGRSAGSKGGKINFSESIITSFLYREIKIT